MREYPKQYPLVLNFKKQFKTRQQFRRFVRNHCEQSKEFAWSDTPERRVFFMLPSREERSKCKKLIIEGLAKLGINADEKR